MNKRPFTKQVATHEGEGYVHQVAPKKYEVILPSGDFIFEGAEKDIIKFIRKKHVGAFYYDRGDAKPV